MPSTSFQPLAVSALIVALGGCATTAVEPAAPALATSPVAAEPAMSPTITHERLFELSKASDEANLKRNPIGAIAQIDTQLRQKPEDSAYYGPIKALPAAIVTADHARLASEYRAAITGHIYPAMSLLTEWRRLQSADTVEKVRQP